jgi:uncharacterized protein (TIGR03437 family)
MKAMRYRHFSLFLILLLLPAIAAWPQIVLDPYPARALGHPLSTPVEQQYVASINPNLVLGVELFSPEGIAVDTSGSSPILYVADTFNSRVLAWKNASSKTLTNLQAPDKIIGQSNSQSTLQGVNGGLSIPTGLLVDSKGNLYIVDSGNDRVVRYPAPFAAGSSATPDVVLGQLSPFTSSAQSGQPSAGTLSLPTNLPAALAMDSSGNLYVTDIGNHRVLRYPAASLTSGTYGPAADIVIGQGDFVTITSPTGQTDRNHIYAPAGLAFDSGGNLFVSDFGANRLMVFAPPFSIGMAATRLAGIVSPLPTTATQSTVTEPEGIVMINNGPGVMDTADNRLLIFDPFSSADWKTTGSTLATPPPVAVALIGQPNYTSSSSNAGNAQPSASTLASPAAGAVAGTDLFIADAANNRVLVFPNVAQAGSATQVLGQSNFPYNSPNYIEGKEVFFGPNVFINNGSAVTLWDAGIVVDSASSPPHLYISDPGNNRVLGFADARSVQAGAVADLVIGQPDLGTAVCNYGGVRVQMAAPGQINQQPTQSSLCYPTGLAVDGSGNLYVADSQNGRVLEFAAPFKSGATALEQATLVLGQSAFTGLKNPTVSQSFMDFPYGLVFDPNNGLLVSDRSSNRVLLFSKDNLASGAAAVKVIGQPDFSSTSSSTLSGPCHIGEDSNARIYVADSGHNQVVIFNSLPDLSTATTVSISTLSGLNSPQAIWVNPTTVAGYPDDIWVGDALHGVYRYPRFALLASPPVPSFQIPPTLEGTASCENSQVNCFAMETLALTQDSFGNLYAADSSNRVAIHYPAVAATNGASFICAGECTLGGLADPLYYLAPGAFASLFAFGGTQFVSSPADFNGVLPVPTTVGGVQVLMNGQPSPIFHVTPNQINLVVPSNAPTVGNAQVQVVQPSTGLILGSGNVTMNTVAPAMFTATQTGIGQIAALNHVDGSVNSASKPVARGQYIELYGTGQGVVPGGPPDGQLPTGTVSTPSNPQVYIGGIQVPSANVTFSGLAPCCVGLWQINVMIPNSTAPSNQVSLLVIYENYNSFNDQAHITTIAVK